MCRHGTNDALVRRWLAAVSVPSALEPAGIARTASVQTRSTWCCAAKGQCGQRHRNTATCKSFIIYIVIVMCLVKILS